jgi:tripartite-type tricarboxylate transporter receptor subunit TctC
MKPPRCTVLHLAAGGAALSAASRTATAQTYPTRPMRIVVGYTPGASTDMTARLMGPMAVRATGSTFHYRESSGGGDK